MKKITQKLLILLLLVFSGNALHSQCTSSNFDPLACGDFIQNTNTSNFTTESTPGNVPFATASDTYYLRSNTQNPWGSTTNQDAMNLAFGAGNWTEVFFETVNPAVLFASPTRFVFMEGSDTSANALNSFLIANLTTIENWVASGNHLLINAAPNEGGNINFGFGGSILIYPSFSSNVNVVDTNHPAFLGPNLPVSAAMSGGSYGHASISGTGFTDVLVDGSNPAIFPLRQKDWGNGLVMMGGMTTTNWHSPQPAAANWRANLLVSLGAFVCPSDITVSNDPGQCSAVVTYTLNETFPPETIPGFTSLGSNNGKSYYLSDAAFTPAAGFSDAIANGGFVATIQDAAKNAFINTQVNAVALGASVLIGFNDVAIEGTFVWQSGAPTTYTNWTVGEPNNFNGIEDYTELISNGLWNDQSSAFTARYVLEITGGFVQTAGLPSGSAFPVGTTTNTFDVTDTNGNTTTCSFDVTVNDTEAPVITCPGDILVDTDAGVCGATVTYSVTASDNCPAPAVEFIVNGGFETGNFTGWSVVDTGNGTYVINDGTFIPTSGQGALPPITGNFDVVTNQGGPGLHILSQFFVVPSNIQSAMVSWNDRIRNAAGTFSDPNQEFRVELIDVSLNVIQEIYSTNPGDPTMQIGPNFRQFDLTALLQTLTGQQVSLRFSEQDNLGFFNLTLDDISFVIQTNGVTQTAGLPSGSVFPVGTTTNTFVTSDASGNTATCSFDVTVEDNEAPIALCYGSVPVYVGSYRVSDGPNWTTNPPVYSPQEAAALIFGGNASDYAISVNSNTSDPNTITNTGWTDSWGDGFAINPENYSLDLGNPGYNDPGGSATAASAWVSDHADFTKINYVWATSTSVVLQLDANGQATLDPALIDAGSTDNCGIASISVSPNNFTCADVGPNTVTLTVTDVNGNSSTCTSTVIVEDNVAPTAVCQNITVQLDANGNVTITPADVDGGSADACGIASTTIDVSTFDCSNVGANNVILTVTDNNGNVSTCTAVVTVEDNVPPVANCAAPFTIQLDANGNASITVADIENGSTDACGIATTTIDVSSFDCSNVGPNTVTLTVTDNNGNVSTCTTVVTVEDNVPPVANCAAPFTIELDANGNASITLADIENGSTDACGIASTSIDITNFTCADKGDNVVTLTVTDNNGNVSTCTTIVTVVDVLAAQIVCPLDIVIDAEPGMCSAQVFFANAFALDNCDGPLGTVQTAGPVSGSTFPLGDTTITFTATDSSGNVSSCSFTITVEDNQAPLAVCQNITIQLDANGVAAITAEDLNGGSTDNCTGALTFAASQTSFDCSHVGANTIILTVTDAAGNSSTCTAIVTVEDNIAPVANCAAPFTIQLDANGNASITEADIDNGSTDNCSVASITLSQSAFTCADLGDNVITLTVTDPSGNSTTCTTIVTVEDTIAPVVSCVAFTLELGADGTALLTPEDIGGTSTDNCAITITAIDIEDFDCSDIGTPVLVTYFASDASGNIASCTAMVTVVDVLAPVIACPADFTVDTDQGSITYTLPDYFGEGLVTATDNCTNPVTIFTQTPAPGTLLLDGTYTITLTATDEYGNEATCTFELTVDTILGADDNRLDFSSLTMYPNPAEFMVTIGNPKFMQIDNIAIYDIQGRLVVSKNTQGATGNQSLDVSNLSSAVYMVIIQSQGKQTVKRLIRK